MKPYVCERRVEQWTNIQVVLALRSLRFQVLWYPISGALEIRHLFVQLITQRKIDTIQCCAGHDGDDDTKPDPVPVITAGKPPHSHDHNPMYRLCLMEQWGNRDGNPYHYLERLIRQETEVLALYETRTAGAGFGLLRGWRLLWLKNNAQLHNFFETYHMVQEPVDDAYAEFPRLGKWALASIACWVVTLSSFIILTTADLGVSGLNDVVTRLVDGVHAPFEVGELWDNLPGRLVALTFALTGVTYYVNDFAVLAPRRIGSRLGSVTEVITRSTAVALTFPILWTMLYDPQAWPLCSGLGTLLVVLNNYVTLQVATRAASTGARFSVRGESARRFVEDIYSEWWKLMGFYSGTMIFVGVLLVADLAHDAAIFAAIVVFINVAKMYRLNCVHWAPFVRGWLSRDILTLRRAACVARVP